MRHIIVIWVTILLIINSFLFIAIPNIEGDEITFEVTLKATEILVKEDFVVLTYINADPILAKKLEDAGSAAVMPLGAPIGTNKGLRTIDSIKIIIEQASVPVIIDAGIGKPSDACLAMEIGADAVMVNTAISTCNNPVEMSESFKWAVQSGRIAYLSGLATENAF